MAQARAYVEDMWHRLVEVGWGILVLVEIYGGEGAGQYHLRVEEEGGPTEWQFDPFDPPAAPPVTTPGTIIDTAYMRPWRFLQSQKRSRLRDPSACPRER